MNIEKMGIIFCPENNSEWMYHYASPVTTVELGDLIRIYFTTRNQVDEEGNFKTYITFIDCLRRDPSRIININKVPLIEHGAPGTFDEHGTMVADVIVHENRFLMYYMGWQRSGTVPYIIRIGLAISEDGVRFNKVSEGPIFGVDRHAPFGVGNVSVLVERGIFHMWYTHYKPWIKTDSGFRPNYDIRYARSDNGIDWKFECLCIAANDDNESLATPCVRKINGEYHMWYSYRPGVDSMGNSGKYGIGYAHSLDMLKWRRSDEKIPMGVSSSGWDSEMVCYPDVLISGEDVYLFYCGNNYGKSGFGYARVTEL